jgi:hypothetical protein
MSKQLQLGTMDIKRRIYNDFFRPSLYDGYEEILRTAKGQGISFIQFFLLKAVFRERSA